MVVSMITKGKYKGFGIKATLTGKLVAQRLSEKIFLDESTIESYEVMNQDEGKASLGKTVGLGAVFGLAGAMVGANSKKNAKTTVKIVWKDGDKSLAEFDKNTYAIFLRNCPL